MVPAGPPPPNWVQMEAGAVGGYGAPVTDPSAAAAPAFNQINFVAADMAATLAFYRALGLPIEAEEGEPHVEVHLPGGMSLEFDDASSIAMWDSGWKATSCGGPAVFNFALPAREAVDSTYESLTAGGLGAGHQRPYDAFWGSRYAIVEDPDGRLVGLMSPRDDDKRSWPPASPPGLDAG
jgi:catechol 2,3-dioxygenase-like lactoylglutathione lyase family enzyme